MLTKLRADLKKQQDPKKAQDLSAYFKTGKGEYGEGDIFLGIPVPECRKIALVYKELPFSDVRTLLQSSVHEERLIALLILVNNFEQGNPPIRKEIFKFYLEHTNYINNWDLVDLSAPKIVGGYLLPEKNRKILARLANSNNLWERRIAMISTFEFIAKNKEYEDTFAIATILIEDRNDLIQKAVGWMLREVGKRVSEELERKFLDKYGKQMGRTALRYAIERFSPSLRAKYLKSEA